MSEDADALQSELHRVSDILVNRVWSKIPQSDAEAVSLFEQWQGAFSLAIKHASNKQAIECALSHWEELNRYLTALGITQY